MRVSGFQGFVGMTLPRAIAKGCSGRLQSWQLVLYLGVLALRDRFSTIYLLHIISFFALGSFACTEPLISNHPMQ